AFGAAVFDLDATVQLTNCTLAVNSLFPSTNANSGGGALCVVSANAGFGSNVFSTATATLVNCILFGTTGGTAFDLQYDTETGGATVNATTPNIVGTSHQVNAAVLNGSGITTADPILGGLNANGGPTQT